MLNSWTDSCGRFVLAEFQDRDVIFRVACVYAPNPNPDTVATLVCGDFNSL